MASQGESERVEETACGAGEHVGERRSEGMTPDALVDLYSGPAHVDWRTQSATIPLRTADAAREGGKGGGLAGVRNQQGGASSHVESQFDGGKPPDVGLCPNTA